MIAVTGWAKMWIITDVCRKTQIRLSDVPDIYTDICVNRSTQITPSQDMVQNMCANDTAVAYYKIKLDPVLNDLCANNYFRLNSLIKTNNTFAQHKFQYNFFFILLFHNDRFS